MNMLESVSMECKQYSQRAEVFPCGVTGLPSGASQGGG